MPYFDNPNKPIQPRPGVYRWYLNGCDSGNKCTLYVGNAYLSTLKRGVDEMCKRPSHKGSVVDTDFIVGSIIEIIEKAACECHWEHIDNNPNNEVQLAINCGHCLQDIVGKKIMIKQSLRKHFTVSAGLKKVIINPALAGDIVNILKNYCPTNGIRVSTRMIESIIVKMNQD